MIKEGFENKGKCPLLKPKMYFILGVSVSIDAMVVGFTVLNNITKVILFKRYIIYWRSNSNNVNNCLYNF